MGGSLLGPAAATKSNEERHKPAVQIGFMRTPGLRELSGACEAGVNRSSRGGRSPLHHVHAADALRGAADLGIDFLQAQSAAGNPGNVIAFEVLEQGLQGYAPGVADDPDVSCSAARLLDGLLHVAVKFWSRIKTHVLNRAERPGLHVGSRGWRLSRHELRREGHRHQLVAFGVKLHRCSRRNHRVAVTGLPFAMTEYEYVRQGSSL